MKPALPCKASPISLRRNFVWTTIGYFFYGACQWIILIIIARLTNTSALGQFSLGLAISAPILMFTNLNLRSLIATDVFGEFSFWCYLRTRLLMSSLAMVPIFGCALFMSRTRCAFWVVIVVGVAKCVESISDLIYGLFQGRERHHLVARSLFLRGGIAVSFLLIVTMMTRNVLLSVTALAFAWLIVLLLHDMPIAKNLTGTNCRSEQFLQEKKRGVYTLCVTAFPLGLAGFLVSLQTSIPRFFVERQLGVSALGVFTALSYFMVLVGRFVLSLNLSISPRLSKYRHEKDDYRFKRLLWGGVVTSIGMGILSVTASVLVGRDVLLIIYGQEYAVYNTVLVVLMGAGAIMYVTQNLEQLSVIQRRVRGQAYIYLISAVVMTVACAALIPVYGLLGAGVAVVAANMVSLILFSLLVFTSN